jgi:hypothetical protein
MAKKILLASLAAVLGIVLLAAGLPVAQQIVQVYVTNFPERQVVEGTVSIAGPIKMTTLTALPDVMVPPVSPKETTRLILGGTIVTDGFAQVVLSLSGQLKGELIRPGSVGAFLLPDQEPILRAFEERGEMQFPLEVVASSPSGASPYFASNQPRFQLGFPRYRVYFYNTGAKSASVSLYAYLTN